MSAPAAQAVLHRFADAGAAAQALALAVAAQLRQAVSERGQARLAVSGGRSPVPLFEALQQQALPWAQVRVLLADERLVPPDHADSNAALVRRHLLQGLAAAATLVPFFSALPPDFEPDAPGAPADPADPARLDALAAQANAALAAAWPPGEPLDVLLLGMGEDGHTASLFAGAPGLARAMAGPARVAWVRPPAAPHARLTLTLPELRAARQAHLLLGGPAKAALLQRALAQAPTPALPVSLVLPRPGAPLQAWLG